MIIAFPVDEKSMDAKISDTFGRAPFFLIYSTVSEKKEFLDHRHVAAQGGSGVRAAQVLADHGVKAVIALQCGANAEKAFRKAEVLVYQLFRDRSAQHRILQKRSAASDGRIQGKR
jgi:predicted Fe-Mo cluster-binding NifX family protein